MNGSAALDNFLCSCCVIAKRAQADKPLAPSVNYGLKICLFCSLNWLETMDSVFILCTSKKPTCGEGKPENIHKNSVYRKPCSTRCLSCRTCLSAVKLVCFQYFLIGCYQKVWSFFFGGNRTRTHLNADVRWTSAATSSKTGGYYDFLSPLRKKMQSSPVVSTARRAEDWADLLEGDADTGRFRDGRPVPYAEDGWCGGGWRGDNPSVCPFGQTPPFTQGRLLRALNERPYERTGGWADSLWGGAGMGGCAAHLISQKSKIFDSFPSRGSLGRGGRQNGGGRSKIAPTCAPGARGKKTTTPQSASLTAPLTRGALGAAAPVRRYGRVKAEGGGAASLPQSASLTALPGPRPFCPLCGHFPR